jgi:hypothetical protein
MSSAYHPQSNGRAEVAVKAVKRLMRTNVSSAGTLDTDCFLKAMLQFRNTPDPDCGISPAQIVFGRHLRDNLLFTDYLNRSQYSKRWQDAWEAKEDALRTRFIRTSENLNKHARPLPPLAPGDKCFVQNQTGQHAKKWYHTGTVMRVLPHDKHAIKMDGSGRVTYRNRRFLRRYTPVSLSVQQGCHPVSPVPYHVECSPPATTEMPDKLALSPVEHEPGRQNVVPEEIRESPESEVPPSQRPQPVISMRGSVPRKEPLALRRLRDFNAPGLGELATDPV